MPDQSSSQSSRRPTVDRGVIAQRCQAVMHKGLVGTLILFDGLPVTGKIEKMSLNGDPDPADTFDPVTVTVAGGPIALGRIREVRGV